MNFIWISFIIYVSNINIVRGSFSFFFIENVISYFYCTFIFFFFLRMIYITKALSKKKNLFQRHCKKKKYKQKHKRKHNMLRWASGPSFGWPDRANLQSSKLRPNPSWLHRVKDGSDWARPRAKITGKWSAHLTWLIFTALIQTLTLNMSFFLGLGVRWWEEKIETNKRLTGFDKIFYSVKLNCVHVEPTTKSSDNAPLDFTSLIVKEYCPHYIILHWLVSIDWWLFITWVCL